MRTTLALAGIHAAERLSPRLAARLASPLFYRVGRPLAVRPSEQALHTQAETFPLMVRGHTIVGYSWGSGPRTVLLVHGWHARAAQFAPIVRGLRTAGLRAVSFDAPANGASKGRRTDIRDYLAAIDALHTRFGRFDVAIGHSFGALAVLTAVREGLPADGVVAIAGMADARYLVDSFADRLRLSPATAEALAARFAHRVFAPDTNPWPRFDAVAAPLPAGIPLLLVHDRGDREVSIRESERLHEAHGERSRLVTREGTGHSRILADDDTLEAVVGFVTSISAGSVS
ncbi:alpha/beta hydrolase [Leifsonia poae]|uniref:alpha/beta hydrolase n=1 Tax=Leifsonia poae TaxID=110933 RepID=UPI001CBA9C89|nr:alpha/beta hydrolase [Leifsonia poae]